MTEDQIRRVNEALAVVTGALTIAMLARIVFGADAVRAMQMRTLRGIALAANKQAAFAESISARAWTAYHRVSNVTV